MNASRQPTVQELSAPARRRNPLDLLMNSGLGKLLRGIGVATPRQDSGESLLDIADALLSLRGRASGPALASAFFDLYEATDLEARQDFLAKVHDLHPADAKAIDKAIAKWNEKRDEASALALNAATESPSAKLINQLNLAPQGTQRLIGMREDLLVGIRPQPCSSESSVTKRCMKSMAGTTCAGASNPSTGAATGFSTRRCATIR